MIPIFVPSLISPPPKTAWPNDKAINTASQSTAVELDYFFISMIFG